MMNREAAAYWIPACAGMTALFYERMTPSVPLAPHLQGLESLTSNLPIAPEITKSL